MKVLFVAALFGGLSFGASSVAHAQTGPAFPMPGKASSEEDARVTTANNAQELARNQRRAAMSPDEVKRDQQLELLEARTGNTSFGARGPDRQFDSNRSGNGFMVRKFKTQPGKPGYVSKRGMGHTAGSSNPAGKPLVHKHKSKHKLLFF
ncbi:hypothetical protein [Hymenobacter siberiensis]|jgi:hypothetical protein|uniref:hypothetical protein n=1 Tax=Hymenobacter siberiensis TaxID=2848396 RepID=UPI001C1E28FB|nr:hypothetical protein [Hymenobacter siberiensis]MBU6119673.1 hypothetical protein [Hymenobacter siberiensis]